MAQSSADLENQMTMNHQTAAAIIALNSALVELKKGEAMDKDKIVERISYARETLLKQEQTLIKNLVKNLR